MLRASLAAAIAAMRSRRSLSIAVTMIWMVVIAFIAAAILVPAGPAAIAQTVAGQLGLSTESSLDISGTVRAAAEALFAIVGTILAAFISKHVKDANARAQILNALPLFAGWGINKFEGAFKDRPMNVNVGSAAAASILRNVLALGPDLIARAGFDERALAKMAVGHLPGVDGAMDEATIDKIIAAAKAGPGASPAPTATDLATQLESVAAPLAETLLGALLPKLEAIVAAKLGGKSAA